MYACMYVCACMYVRMDGWMVNRVRLRVAVEVAPVAVAVAVAAAAAVVPAPAAPCGQRPPVHLAVRGGDVG